ncbi:MAG: 50S ribosomal protein L11 methyltransferase, partial [SAR324 cluster bacterium]|nr:50S ribosomal protein L11 methyltransferase [SAR324 cluster bacterium]
VFLEHGRDFRRLTAQGGELILSGMLNEEAPEVSRTFKGEGFAVIESAERAGWSAFRFRRSDPPGR